jgi:hypothetical protein
MSSEPISYPPPKPFSKKGTRQDDGVKTDVVWYAVKRYAEMYRSVVCTFHISLGRHAKLKTKEGPR